MGLPGLGNFIAEFLVLVGTYRVSPLATVLASIGLIISTVYALGSSRRAFQGREREPVRIQDLGAREMAMATALVVAIVWLGTVSAAGGRRGGPRRSPVSRRHSRATRQHHDGPAR